MSNDGFIWVHTTSRFKGGKKVLLSYKFLYAAYEIRWNKMGNFPSHLNIFSKVPDIQKKSFSCDRDIAWIWWWFKFSHDSVKLFDVQFVKSKSAHMFSIPCSQNSLRKILENVIIHCTENSFFSGGVVAQVGEGAQPVVAPHRKFVPFSEDALKLDV